MKKYKIQAFVNGNVTEAVITARDSYSARKLFESQYSGCKVTIYNVQPVS